MKESEKITWTHRNEDDEDSVVTGCSLLLCLVSPSFPCSFVSPVLFLGFSSLVSRSGFRVFLPVPLLRTKKVVIKV